MISLELIRNAIKNPSSYGFTLAFVGAVGIFAYSIYDSSNIWKENEIGENFVTIQLSAFAPPSKDKISDRIQKPKHIKKPIPKHKVIQAPPQPIPSELQAMEKPQEEVEEAKKDEDIKEDVQEAKEATTIQSNPDAFAEENIKILRFSDGIDNEFLKAIRLALQKRLDYPHLARQRGYEGEIFVKFLLDSKGKVSRIEIVRASKHHILNKSAVKTVKKACKDFPKPGEMTYIEVPIVYTLEKM